MVSRVRRKKTTNSTMKRNNSNPPATALIKTITELQMDSELQPAAIILMEKMCHVQMLHSTPYIDLTDVKFNAIEYISSDKRTFTENYIEKALAKQTTKAIDIPTQNKATQTDLEEVKTPKSLQEDTLEKPATTFSARKLSRSKAEKSAVAPETTKIAETTDPSMDNDNEVKNETPSSSKKISTSVKKSSRQTKFIISSDEEDVTVCNVLDENLLLNSRLDDEAEIDTVVDDNSIDNNSDKHSDSERDQSTVDKNLIVDRSCNEEQRPEEEGNTNLHKNVVIPTQDFMDFLAGDEEKAKKYGIELQDTSLTDHAARGSTHAERIETNNQLAENCKKLLNQLISCYEPSSIADIPDVNHIEEDPEKETDESEIDLVSNKSSKNRKICFSEEEAGIVSSESVLDQEEATVVESDSEHEITAPEAVKEVMDTPEESAKEESEIEDIEGNHKDSTEPQVSAKVKSRKAYKKLKLLSGTNEKQCTTMNVDKENHNESQVALKKRPSFKIRFSKGFELNKPVCSMCQSVFRKKVDLEVHCLRHLDNRSLIVNVMRRKLPQTYDTSKNDIDKYLKPKKRMSTPFMDVDAAKDLLSKYCLDEMYLEPFDSVLENDISMSKSKECLDGSMNSSQDAEDVGEEAEQANKDIALGEENKTLDESEENVNHVKVLSDITVVPGYKAEHIAKMSLEGIEMKLNGEDEIGDEIVREKPGTNNVNEDVPEETILEHNEGRPAEMVVEVEPVGEAEFSDGKETVDSEAPTEKVSESDVFEIENKEHDSDSSISSRDTVILPQDQEVETYTEEEIENEIIASQNTNIVDNDDDCVDLEEHIGDEINLEVSSPVKSPALLKKRLRDSDDEIFETPAKKQRESDVINASNSSVEDYVSCIDETSPAIEKKSLITDKRAVESNNGLVSTESSPSKCSEMSDDDNPQLMLKLANLDKQMQEIIEGNKEQKNDCIDLDCTLVEEDKAELKESE